MNKKRTPPALTPHDVRVMKAQDYKAAFCINCGRTKDEHYEPTSNQGTFYCSDDSDNMDIFESDLSLQNRDRRHITIGRGVRYLRRKTGLTQEGFAQKIKIKRSTFASYEEGRAEPNLEILYRMTLISGITMDEFFKEFTPYNIE